MFLSDHSPSSSSILEIKQLIFSKWKNDDKGNLNFFYLIKCMGVGNNIYRREKGKGN